MTRVGGSEEQKVAARVVTATTRKGRATDEALKAEYEKTIDTFKNQACVSHILVLAGQGPTQDPTTGATVPPPASTSGTSRDGGGIVMMAAGGGALSLVSGGGNITFGGTVDGSGRSGGDLYVGGGANAVTVSTGAVQYNTTQAYTGVTTLNAIVAPLTVPTPLALCNGHQIDQRILKHFAVHFQRRHIGVGAQPRHHGVANVPHATAMRRIHALIESGHIETDTWRTRRRRIGRRFAHRASPSL